MDPDPVEELLEEVTARLAEHCDSVRIFVTVHEGGQQTTVSYSRGRGNVLAQYGQIKQWILAKDQEARDEAMDQEEE